ncbi:MAG: hypothetical protein KDI90_08740 [Alphaproteobacteria bacterium]|nr:hypothetical protein [Alphaproteobacteria bacterium]
MERYINNLSKLLWKVSLRFWAILLVVLFCAVPAHLYATQRFEGLLSWRSSIDSQQIKYIVLLTEPKYFYKQTNKDFTDQTLDDIELVYRQSVHDLVLKAQRSSISVSTAKKRNRYFRSPEKLIPSNFNLKGDVEKDYKFSINAQGTLIPSSIKNPRRDQSSGNELLKAFLLILPADNTIKYERVPYTFKRPSRHNVPFCYEGNPFPKYAKLKKVESDLTIDLLDHSKNAHGDNLVKMKYQMREFFQERYEGSKELFYQFCYYEGYHLFNMTKGSLEAVKGAFKIGTAEQNRYDSYKESGVLPPYSGHIHVSLIRAQNGLSKEVLSFFSDEESALRNIRPYTSAEERLRVAQESSAEIKAITQKYEDPPPQKEMFFIENATFSEDLNTLGKRLQPVDMENIFPFKENASMLTQHEIKAGKGAIIAFRTFIPSFRVHGDEYEKITLHLPDLPSTPSMEKTFGKGEFEGFYSKSSPDARNTNGHFAVVKDGTVTIKRIDSDHLEVTLDLLIQANTTNNAELDAKFDYPIKEKYRIERKDIASLTPWEGRPEEDSDLGDQTAPE